MEESVTFASESDRAFWEAFESRLASSPALADRPSLRHELVRTAYADMTGRGCPTTMPAEYADVVYRLRFELGPTVSDDTLDQVRDLHAADAANLLAEGVDPRLLGLVG